MKRILFPLLFAGLFTIMFTACNDKDDDGGDSKEDYYTVPIGQIFLYQEGQDLSDITNLKACFNYNNWFLVSLDDISFSPEDAMELKFPTDLSTLNYMTDFFDDSMLSDPSAKWTDQVYIIAYADSKAVGHLMPVKVEGDAITWVFYVYVNSDVVIDGEGEDENDVPITVKCSLSKGWNRIARKTIVWGEEQYIEKIELSTVIPSGLEWCFFEVYDETRSFGGERLFNLGPDVFIKK